MPVAFAKTAHCAVFIRGNPFVRFLRCKNAAACRLFEPYTKKIKKLTAKIAVSFFGSPCLVRTDDPSVNRLQKN